MSAIHNKRLMHEIFAGLVNRDGTLFIERMADDFRWINIGSNKWSGTFDGKEAVLRDLLGAAAGEADGAVAHRGASLLRQRRSRDRRGARRQRHPERKAYDTR